MNDHRNMLRTALKSCNLLRISLIHNTLLLHDILEAAYDAARGDLQREDLPPTHAATVYPRALHVLLPLQNAAKRVFTRKNQLRYSRERAVQSFEILVTNHVFLEIYSYSLYLLISSPGNARHPGRGR